MPSRALLAALAVLFTLPAMPVGAQVRPGGTVVRPIPPPLTVRPLATMPALSATGISVQMQNPHFGNVSLGSASTFELQEVSPVASGGAAAGRRQMTGTIQFSAGDQQAMQANSCFVVKCEATLVITSASPQGTTVYKLSHLNFTKVVSGPPVGVTFAYQDIAWQVSGPGGSPPPPAPPAPTASAVPMGISVGFEARTTGSMSLGMASTFQLLEVSPVAQGSGGLGGRLQLSGTIQFAAGVQAMPALACFTVNCEANLTIINATPQGTNVFKLTNVAFTEVTIGPIVTASFVYQSIDWQVLAADGVQLHVSPALASASAAPMGISIGFRNSRWGASTGMASTFQLEEVAPADASTGAAGRRQLSGAIQYVAGDPQATLISQCFTVNCAAELTITDATPQGTTSYVLGNAALTRLVIGPTVTVSFVFQTMRWDAFAAGSSQPQAAVAVPASVPMGVSVGFRPPTASSGATVPGGVVWLGMASTFQLSTGTQGTGTIESPPNARATGSVQFVPGDPQAMQLSSCFIDGCVAGLTITNAMPQGTNVYTLRNVSFTRLVIGPMVTAAFQYQSVESHTVTLDVLRARPVAPLTIPPGAAPRPTPR